MSEVKLNARKKQKTLEDSKEKLLPYSDEKLENHPNLQGDILNIVLLLLLYLLQGIPLGLTSAIPMLLQNRGANYKQQAEFSFSYFPFSLKLLWAPIVDSLFYAKFGRRKSWLVPTQYLIGLFMVILSYHVDQWIGGSTNTDNFTPDVKSLTLIFFALNFLAATQDIAVDGWALTMLKRCNVSYASTCNSVGQTAGYFLGYVVFIALESKVFCNNYLRAVPEERGIVTLSQFLWFWGICFFVITSLIALLKKESPENHNTQNMEKHEFNIWESYQNLIKILKLKPIQILIIILLTVKVTFSASDAVSSLKLIDAGVPKEKLALLAIPIIPLQIILPVIVSKYTNGPEPLKFYIKAFLPRMLFAFIATVIVAVTPYIIKSGEEIPIFYYVMLIINYAIYQIFLYIMFVSIMAFFARISDPAVGGTYMTLLNTVCNLGGNWPNTVALWLIDGLTYKKCVNNSAEDTKITANSCYSEEDKNLCTATGGLCQITVDGYYVESLVCAVYGILWLTISRKWIYHLQSLPIKEWLIVNSKRKCKSR
ncbi:acetyl-coenzyme A transporter 1 [Condylostylus longicornis]|uniref:acetyl-coenzyme A transporter 1 n=1 Tax=Condylostylus longicornis TaxID=2530218 RepID=UPI00244E3517|nr:acetyl-coenzyme A transporter 1 [Condylostylus longicornis]